MLIIDFMVHLLKNIILYIKIEVMTFFICNFFNLDHHLEILLNVSYTLK